MGERKSLMRSFGEFVGHITHAVRKPVPGGERREIRREVETEDRDTPQGKVTLRRTTIEEIEVEPDDSAPRGS